MSIHVALNHVTEYRYDRWVTLSPQQVRLRPAPHCRTPILSYSQRVTPAEHFLNWQQDPHSNYIARLTFPEPVREFRIEIDLVAEMAVYNPFDFFLEPSAETFPFSYGEWEQHELQPYLQAEPLSAVAAKYLASLDRSPRRTIDTLVDINRKLQQDIHYLIRLDPGVQTIDETLTRASGSCRDTTWVLVQLFRHLGIAARFVSGYLIQLTADVKPVDGPAGPVQDFTDLHAWCEAYLPGAGWVGFDPTSGLLAGEGHIPLACTPSPTGAAPVTGGVSESEVEFSHHMAVRRIYESPRVTKPYTDAQWQTIVDLGHTVDRELAHDGVGLTMGGEPTFVSAADRDADEWNLSALGPTKRLLGADLITRLQQHYGAGGFFHFGEGKWYPGEPLPRWSLRCYWRNDGQPAWSDPSLFADERHPDDRTDADASRFIRHLASELGVADSHVQAGYEDVYYYLWRERRLPANVDPFDARLDNELERDRLRRIFTQGLAAVVGYALPLRFVGGAEPWATGPWFLRAERLYLYPGDSPMGLRLPLDSLPWAVEGDLDERFERDPFAPREPLPDFDVPQTDRPTMQVRIPASQATHVTKGVLAIGGASGSSDVRLGGDGSLSPLSPTRGASARGVVRSALCVEPRQGTLYVFTPPVELVEGYLDLVAAVERTARALGVRVILEGYPPPDDHRLSQISVTPDPGVLEVNVQPASTWDQLVEQTTTLYEEARQIGLTTEKFMVDGRHTGTGGGNHFVLGGASPAESPFLRRPDLLRSLVGYWHNHPSLSYLFSGLFLGPTSQAPRVDEARNDSLYELEIAFGHLPSRETPALPWLVDRSLRNLLVDITGNTHRAEFCIDKLYPAESSSGRRGLLELRAFEMPPHARMSLVQQLLLRALVARFWREPYEAPLVRWGTQLHDRFMLPYFVALDFEDVLEEVSRAGYPMPFEWFAPHFEFRFPVAGELTVRGLHLTMRQALEPWHVLGEEATATGTARYVDSSVERLEVLVAGITGDRFAITCNGRTLPLHPTGREGEAVSGVRFRAWHPPSALHPEVPVHAPLTFDIVDTWMDRSVAGCQYHVMHPGGINSERLPVNSLEAESRRLARFTILAQTPGPVRALAPKRSREFPFTLDLRSGNQKAS